MLMNDEKSRKAAEFLWRYDMSIRDGSDILQTETRSNREALPIRLNITKCVADLESLRIVVWQNV